MKLADQSIGWYRLLLQTNTCTSTCLLIHQFISRVWLLEKSPQALKYSATTCPASVQSAISPSTRQRSSSPVDSSGTRSASSATSATSAWTRPTSTPMRRPSGASSAMEDASALRDTDLVVALAPCQWTLVSTWATAIPLWPTNHQAWMPEKRHWRKTPEEWRRVHHFCVSRQHLKRSICVRRMSSHFKVFHSSSHLLHWLNTCSTHTLLPNLK